MNFLIKDQIQVTLGASKKWLRDRDVSFASRKDLAGKIDPSPNPLLSDDHNVNKNETKLD